MTVYAKLFLTSMVYWCISFLIVRIIAEVNPEGGLFGAAATLAFLISFIGMIISALFWIWS